MSAPYSVGPRSSIPPPRPTPPSVPPKNPKRRSSGSGGNAPLPPPPPLQVRSTTKPKAPSLSHVINHINESPKPELKSFLSLDSAVTPKTTTTTTGSTSATTPSHPNSISRRNSRTSIAASRTSIAASSHTMSIYNIELPPLRMEGLMEMMRGKGGGEYEPSPSSASSYTLTPTLTAGTALTTPESASTMKGHERRLPAPARLPPPPPLSPGSESGSRPSSRASSSASVDSADESVILTPVADEAGVGTGAGAAPWDLKSGWRDSVAVTRALDDLDQLHRTMGGEDDDDEEDEEGKGFLDEVDQWLVYIGKRIRQLERRHRRLESAGVAGQKDERYDAVHIASGVYGFY